MILILSKKLKFPKRLAIHINRRTTSSFPVLLSKTITMFNKTNICLAFTILCLMFLSNIEGKPTYSYEDQYQKPPVNVDVKVSVGGQGGTGNPFEFSLNLLGNILKMIPTAQTSVSVRQENLQEKPNVAIERQGFPSPM